MSDAPTVAQALAAVMGELRGIGKDDKAPEGYAYRGIEAVTRQLQPLLAKHGVVIAPSATITEVRPSPAMKEGWQDVYMQESWTITGPDGSSIAAQTTGIGRDKSDKGANKAQTQAFKYLLLHLFCISDANDDADGQTYEHERQAVSPFISGENVERFKAKCVEVGVDPADVVASVTSNRTDNPAELLKSEVGAAKAEMERLAAHPTVAAPVQPALVEA